MNIPNIKFTRLKIHLRALEKIRLPVFPGASFRGGFGAALRRACCTMDRQPCQDCMLKTSCVYAAVFETASDHTSHALYQLSDFPRPFIIEPQFPVPEVISAGESFFCHLILIGHAVNYLPYFIYAFSSLGNAGLGKGRERFKLDSVETAMNTKGKTIFNGKSQQFLDSPQISSFAEFFSEDDKNEKLSLTFETPTRIKHENILTDDLSFELFMKNLLRRLLLLIQISHNSPWDLDYKAFLNKSKGITKVKSDLYWYDWKRYSNRQKMTMKLGGFMGNIIFQGEITPFLPFIRLGEFVHVGKACTFGLGKYRMEIET